MSCCALICAAASMVNVSNADLAGLSVDPTAMVEGARLFMQGAAVWRNVRAREARHAADLARRGVAEVPPSKAAVRYSIDTGGFGNLLVDDWGELYIDRRFITDDEMKTVKEIESFVWRHVITPLQEAKVLPDAGRQKPVRPAKRQPPAKRKPREHAGGAGLPVFRGFEDERYQRHDALIARMTAEFNAGKAKWCGGTAAQAGKIADLTPAQVKSHMIEESGGNGPRSLAAWKVDPLQVNVPGDWGAEKELLGLKKPSKRNEGTAEGNVRAAIMYLSRKGFGASGLPAAKRPKGFFDGWRDALRRYNGRRDRTETDRYYSDEYADKIMRRAANPDTFVPIEIKLAPKKK
ncbi:MAG: hypothetical protein K6F50_06515 [Kiritimatiellae bacterium]|nr:hypothetical protein [Kiritimatiellia bacterium]